MLTYRYFIPSLVYSNDKKPAEYISTIWNPKRVSPPNGFVLKLNGENYTTYDDLLRLHQFFMVGSVEVADPLGAQMIYQDQMG